MAKNTGRGGTRPTGPNKSTQGKPLASRVTPDNRGPVDTANSNGRWDDCACIEGNVKTGVVRGSRKSF